MQSCLRTPACDPHHCIPPAPPATTGAAPAPHRTRLTAPVIALSLALPPSPLVLPGGSARSSLADAEVAQDHSLADAEVAEDHVEHLLHVHLPTRPAAHARSPPPHSIPPHPPPPHQTPEPSPAPRRDFVRRWQCARGCSALSRTRLGDGAWRGGVCEWLQGRIGRAPRHRWRRVNRGRCPGLLPGGLSASPTSRSACTTPHDAGSHAGPGARGHGSPRRPS